MKKTLKAAPPQDIGLPSLLRLHLELKDVKPSIWRQAEISSSLTLTGLHHCIQTLFGWHDSHLWAIHAGSRRFELMEPGFDQVVGKAENPDTTLTSELLHEAGVSILYNYDFGDDWFVLATLEAIVPAAPGVRYPRCLAGERAGPPEDCGGLPGFERLLAARKAPRNRESRELLEWVGPGWNPESFNIEMLNKALLARSAPRRVQ
jgi:hypothetical protein